MLRRLFASFGLMAQTLAAFQELAVALFAGVFAVVDDNATA